MRLTRRPDGTISHEVLDVEPHTPHPHVGPKRSASRWKRLCLDVLPYDNEVTATAIRTYENVPDELVQLMELLGLEAVENIHYAMLGTRALRERR